MKMNLTVMEYMVWVIEIVSDEFFKGNKTAAYDALKLSEIWDLYIEHYDTTHSLSKEYLLDEIREAFNEKGVVFSC